MGVKNATRLLQRIVLALTLALALAGCRSGTNSPTPAPILASAETIDLPPPREQGPMSLEQTLAQRRSTRRYSDQTLSLEQLSQLLWAAQGITSPQGFRTAPSAGALYPLELYLVSPDGLYHYQPQSHQLQPLVAQDLRPAVWQVGLEQDPLRKAPAVFVICAVYQRTADKYGQRATRYVHLEAGHAAQNLLLQAVALDLVGVPIGAFHDEPLQAALSLPEGHEPLYLIPIGHPPE